MKRNNKTRIIIPILVILFILIIISGVLFLWYTLSGNYINIQNIDDMANDVTLQEASASSPIVVNSIVVGATKNGKWISASKFYEANSNVTQLELDVFSTNAKYGTYKTASFKRYANSTVYTTIAKEGMLDKYIAVKTTTESKILPGMTKLEATKQDEEFVKDAIGSYDLINGSVKVLEVYGTNINEVTDKIICATSKEANLLGAYSAVLYVTGNKAYLVKYSYVRDIENSDRWPVYSLQFVMDLNYDLKPEIVLQETTGNDVTYSVLELRDNNKFYQVLSATVQL